MAIFTLNINELVILRELAYSNLKVLNASDALVISENLGYNIHFESIAERLILTHEVALNKIVHLNVAEHVAIAEDAQPRVHVLDIFEIMAISEYANNRNVGDRLIITELAAGRTNKAIFDSLVIKEALSSKFTYNLHIAEVLAIVEGATGDTLGVCIPGVQINTHLVTFTSYVNGNQLILPAPNFDNVERFEWNRVNKKTRGGDLIIYRDPIWPKAQTLIYKWNYLQAKQRETALLFLRRTLGQLLLLVDYEGREFVGVIKNPDAEFSQQQRFANTVSIQFEVQ